MDEAPKKRLSTTQVKVLLPILREFNKLAKVFLGILDQKIQAKENRINTLSVMVTDMKIPASQHTISISTVDMGNTKVTRSGGGTYSKRMDWEKDLPKNKGRSVIV